MALEAIISNQQVSNLLAAIDCRKTVTSISTQVTGNKVKNIKV